MGPREKRGQRVPGTSWSYPTAIKEPTQFYSSDVFFGLKNGLLLDPLM